jgi:hypothetical protein
MFRSGSKRVPTPPRPERWPRVASWDGTPETKDEGGPVEFPDPAAHNNETPYKMLAGKIDRGKQERAVAARRVWL